MSLLWAWFASSTGQNQSRPIHETIEATTEQTHSKERGCSRLSPSEKALLPELPYLFGCSVKSAIHIAPDFLIKKF